MNVELLSRVQFALTASFHFIYPPLSMGLGLMLVIIGIIYVRTKDPKWRRLSFFWVKVYGLIFAIGVATGVVMEFEFGTNWANYSRFVGNIFGSLLAAEGVFAFFLEGGFLGLMLFGGNRLGPRMWLGATFMVVFGAHFSALWIIMANSWMQTPAGYTVEALPLPARAYMTDFAQVVFTPSFMSRLLHTLGASWTAGSALMLSVSAWFILRKRDVEVAKSNFKVALPVFALFAFVNVAFFGAGQAVEVTNFQPIKLASFEGLWETQSCAPMYLVGWVDEAAQTTTGIKIPCLLSLLAYMDPQAVVTGLEAFPPDQYPPINLVFQVYHAMIGLGSLYIPIGFSGRPVVFLEAQNLRAALGAVAVCHHRLPDAGLHHGGLVVGRNRSAAVDCVWPPADCSGHLTYRHRHRCDHLHGDVRAAVSAVVCPVHLLVE